MVKPSLNVSNYIYFTALLSVALHAVNTSICAPSEKCLDTPVLDTLQLTVFPQNRAALVFSLTTQMIYKTRCSP